MPKLLENLNDILGKKFGKLIVKLYIGCEIKGKQREYYYICDCGTKNIKTTRHILIKGDKISCGCAKKDAGLKRKENLIGKKFGRWYVLDFAPNQYSVSGKSYSTMWKCKCKCGVIKNIRGRALKTGMSQSCGCLQKEQVSKSITIDLKGKQFGFLTVIERNGSRLHSKHSTTTDAVWKCRCFCGNEINVVSPLLRNGDIISCGCVKASKGELYVSQYLQICGYVENVDFIKEKSFSNLVGIGKNPLRFDFYVILKDGSKVLIECQGKQHYKPCDWFGGKLYFDKLQIHNKRKQLFAKKNNIKLIEIPFTKYSFDEIENLLKINNVY